MSIVPNSAAVSTRKRSSSKAQSSLNGDRRVVITPRKQKSPTSLESRLPMWFLYLRSLQRRFGIATYLLIAGMLVMYSSTAYLQQRWNQEYRKLEHLQRYERQLITTNEALKNQLAKEAEQPATELVSPNPAAAIVLPSSSPKGDRLISTRDAHPQLKIDIPGGY